MPGSVIATHFRSRDSRIPQLKSQDESRDDSPGGAGEAGGAAARSAQRKSARSACASPACRNGEPRADASAARGKRPAELAAIAAGNSSRRNRIACLERNRRLGLIRRTVSSYRSHGSHLATPQELRLPYSPRKH